MPGVLWSRELCRAMAAEIAPATLEVVQTLLVDRVVDRHARVVRLLRLRDRVGDQRLEAACARALRFGDLTYLTIKRILDQHLEMEVPAAPPRPAPARTFVRTATDLLGHLFGGMTWN